VLVVRRIHVAYRLRVDDLDDDRRAKIDRALAAHAGHCPVARTIGGCVDITTSLELEKGEPGPR
jgi:uncharacterized OsmC-like protein